MLEHGTDAKSSSGYFNCNTNGGVLEQWGKLNREDSRELPAQLVKGALIASQNPEIPPKIRSKD